MSHKTSPTALRLNLNKEWRSIWFSDDKNFSRLFIQDLKIKNYLKKSLSAAGLDRVVVKRLANMIEVEVHVARPGVVIGRAGSGIDTIKAQLKKMVKSQVEIKIVEVKQPDLSARIIARSIADAIEKRQPPKLLMVSYKNKAVVAGARGVKIAISGRVGNNQARTIKDSSGPVPLQTLRADIEYAEERAQTVDSGIIGVKVWVYKPSKLDIK